MAVRFGGLMFRLERGQSTSVLRQLVRITEPEWIPIWSEQNGVNMYIFCCELCAYFL